jgi:hypothetical protein
MVVPLDAGFDMPVDRGEQTAGAAADPAAFVADGNAPEEEGALLFEWLTVCPSGLPCLVVGGFYFGRQSAGLQLPGVCATLVSGQTIDPGKWPQPSRMKNSV